MIDKEQILHYEIADTVLVNLVKLAAMEVSGVVGVSTSYVLVLMDKERGELQ